MSILKPAILSETRDCALISCLSEQERRRVEYWNNFDPFVNYRMHWRSSMMRHLFHILPGQKILEIGAGNGKFTASLMRVTRGECDITACVFSLKFKKQIDALLQNANVNVDYVDELFDIAKRGKFDFIISHHMLNNEFTSEFLIMVKKLLKPKGGILLFEPNPWNPYYRLRRIIKTIIPLKWRRPVEQITLNRLQMFSVLSDIGFTQINTLPYDFLYSPVPKFLLWPAQHMSIIMENTPYLRNFAGSLYIWARNPAPDDFKANFVDLCEHEEFFDRVSFVIPCHNEEMNVGPLIENINNFYGKYVYEILIIDDNSTDKTYSVASDISQKDHRVKVIKRAPPNGVGRALRDGLKAAKGEYIVIMDSDFQHIIPEMRDLFNAIKNGADVAVGSRFSRNSVLVNYAFTKIIANRAFHMLANIFLGKRFRDLSNNLKIFRRHVAKSIIIESNDFAANVETGLKPLLLGYRVDEVPISWVDRSSIMGLSTFKICKTGPNYFKLLLKLIWRRIIRKNYQGRPVQIKN
ncbi:MAG: glycosyltransferase [Candidatus Omnitrophota bacterium]